MSVFKRYKGVRITSSHPKYKSSKWCCEFYLDGITHKQSIPDARNKKEAEEFEYEFKQSIKTGGRSTFLDKTTFTDFVDEIYLPYAKNKNPSYAQKVLESETLKIFFGNTRLKAIKPYLIEQFKTKRLNESIRCQKCKFGKNHVCESRKISPSTVNRELSTLSMILTLAWRNRKIDENPMRFVPKLEEPDARERFLTPDERSRLLEVLQDYSQLRDIVLLGIFTGWRKGQILGLRKSAIDSTNQSVTIIKSKGTKARKVPVSTVVWEILTKLSNDTEDFLFINHLTGQPLLNFDKTWRTALTKAKIEGLHFHDLRRTFAVEMLNIKADSLEIQSALGHSDIRTTKIYAQVQNQPLRDSLDRITDGFKIHDFAIIQPSGKIAH